MSSTPGRGSKTLAIAGASGVVGRHLVSAAVERGWQVRVLTRRPESYDVASERVQCFGWDPQRAAGGGATAVEAVALALEGADVVVNLAGASLADGRLDAPHKARVLNSRIFATEALVAGWAAACVPPQCWLQASAVGYYGHCGDDDVDEDSKRGQLFLSEVCEAWERVVRNTLWGEPEPRVCFLRLGLVLASDAPAWQKMLAPIRWCVGGALGSGRQFYPWIDADDVAAACFFLATHDAAHGVFNVVAPQPVRQKHLARKTARALGRFALVPAPAFVLRVILGPVADELLLPSCNAQPRRLLDLGFSFSRSTIDEELAALLP